MLVVDHKESIKLDIAGVNKLCPLLIVPGGEGSEHCRYVTCAPATNTITYKAGRYK